MHNKQLRTIKRLLKQFHAIPTWTKAKHRLYARIEEMITAGECISFGTHVWRGLGNSMGEHVVLDLPGHKQGHLAVYAGQRCFVMCTGQGSHFNRYYLACPIWPDPNFAADITHPSSPHLNITDTIPYPLATAPPSIPPTSRCASAPTAPWPNGPNTLSSSPRTQQQGRSGAMRAMPRPIGGCTMNWWPWATRPSA